MNDLQILHDELLIGHPVTGPYSADAATAAEQINAVNRTRTVPISSGELLAWSAGAGAGDRPRIIKIEQGTTAADEQVAAICKVAEGTIKRDGTELDLLKLDRVAMVAALVAAGVLSQADSDSLYALATRQISRADEIGLSNVRAGTVEQARALTPAQQGVI
jgi:hypothetical protein